MNETPPPDGPESPPPDGPKTPPNEGAPPPPSQTPPPTAPPGGPPPSGDKTVMFILSYLWILALVPLLTDKDDPEVQWHAKNGIMFMAAELVIWIAYWILSFITGVFLGCFLAVLGLAALLAFLTIHVMAIIKATRGERLRMPVVSDFADQWQ